MTQGKQRKVTLIKAIIIAFKNLTLADVVKGVILTILVVVLAYFSVQISLQNVKEDDNVRAANIELEVIVEKNLVSTVKKVASNVESTKEVVSNQEKEDIQKVQQIHEHKYSEYEKMALAKIISAEAGDAYSEKRSRQAMDAGITSDIWQQYVGYVVMNRVASKKFPGYIEGVLKDGYAQETIDKFYKGYYTENAVKNAEIVLENYYNETVPVPKNMVYQAEFSQGKEYLHVGNTFFGLDE